MIRRLIGHGEKMAGEKTRCLQDFYYGHLGEE